MSIDIFIRTYKNDIEWLKYCLKSIHKYVTGYNKIVVCIPEGQEKLLKDFNLRNLYTCPVYKDDYLGQQITKVNADLYCESEYILYVDSDCVFTKPTDLSDFFVNGKPLIYMTNYGKVGDAICWKNITEITLNRKGIDWEFMRRMPLVYHRDTLAEFKDYIELIHGVTVDNFIVRQSHRNFSEFNAIGAFAYYFYPEKYHFHDTDYGVGEEIVKQRWSWGGITPEIRKELELTCE